MLDVPTSSHSELKGTRVGSSVTSLLSASRASVAKIVFRLGVTVGMRSAEAGAEVYVKSILNILHISFKSSRARDGLLSDHSLVKGVVYGLLDGLIISAFELR